MSTNTIIQQGRFTATGGDIFIPLRGGVSWMNLYNSTNLDNLTDGAITSAYWQLGLPADTGFVTAFVEISASIASVQTYQPLDGFTLIDTSLSLPGTINATVTAVSTASIPVASNSGTNGLAAGDVVRLFNVAGAKQLGGLDFTVGYNTLTSGTFSLDYMAQLGGAGTTGSWMKVAFDPIYYPRRRMITKITRATQAVVTLSVTHGYKVGQQVRLSIPSVFGMTQMNGLQATIVAINTTTTSGNTITLDVDSSAFTAFAFPTTAVAANAFTPAEVIPMGEDTAFANAEGVNALSDATINQAEIGMILAGGAGAVGGVASDVIYWTAGTAFSIDNQ